MGDSELTTDQELVAKLQNGDLDALGILYDRYQRMVYRTALGITNDPEVAADLLQDVFLRLYRFSHRIDGARPLKPWLYRATANLTYTWIKRNRRGVRCVQELASVLATERRPSPASIAERDEERGTVLQAIASLPLAQRMAVVLYYIDGLSLQETSEALNIPVGTAKSRLHYGRNALKKMLGLDGKAFSEVLYEFS